MRKYDMTRDHHIELKQCWYQIERNDPNGAIDAVHHQKKFRGTCHYECECLMAYIKLFRRYGSDDGK